jgi:hypothetical protein
MKKLLIFILLFISIGLSAVDSYRGNCLDFDGNLDFAVEDSNVIPATGSFTVSVWAKADPGISYIQEIVSQDAGTGGANFYIGYSWGMIRCGDDWQTTYVPYPTDNQWHYFTVTKNSGNTWLYLDGVEVAERGSAMLNPRGNEFKIGTQYGNYGEYFTGEIDEVRIWNTCLNTTQIKNTMNITLNATESGLIHYYQFNESSGTNLSDCIGSANGIVFGASWITSTVPMIYTTSATNIGYGSATSGGNILYNAGDPATSRGVCWNTSPNPTTANPHTTNGNGNGVFTSGITGLTPSTTYYYRAFAINSVGVGYGKEYSFTTLDFAVPTLSTTIAFSITQTTASSGGNTIDNNSPVATSRGVCWSTTGNPTTSNPHTTDGTGNGVFTSSITGLIPSTTYYYRAYAVNTVGTGYGEEYSFTTLDPGIPTISTTIAASITQATASSGGDVISDGGDAVTARGVCWSTGANPTTADFHTTNGTGTGPFSSSITGLNPFTLYYYRAYATNSIGTGYGAEYSFATTPAGSGTDADPYQISSLNELRWLSENSSFWSSHFIQTADIDAGDTQNWNGGGFSPIGNGNISFTGNYDGQGYIIVGLYIERDSYVGLFGYIYEGAVSNVGIENTDIRGENYVGGLAGYSLNVYISNCYSSGNVDGNFNVGGLAGYNYFSTITNCYSTGSVNGSAYVGGLAGYCSDVCISNCYSSGSVSGDSNVGGLVGDDLSSEVRNSFWDIETSGQSTSNGGTGKTTAEMQTQSTFTNVSWDFNTIWDMDGVNNNGYPFLQWQNFPPIIPGVPQNVIISDSNGTIQLYWDVVIGANSYKVYSSNNPNGTFAEDISGTFTGESWTAPISTTMKYYYVKAVN